MRQPVIFAFLLFASLPGTMGYAKADTCTVNLIVNPDFDRVYAAQRQESPDPLYHRADHGMLPKFEGKPLMPYGWALQVSKDQAATVSWVDDGGRKALRAVVPKGESLRLCQGYVEVVPEGTYDFGLSAKGSGRVDLNVWASEPAPAQTLAGTGIDAGSEWRKIHAQKKVGPHRHLAIFCIVISGPADVTIRQAEFSVQTASAPPVNPLLVKPSKDNDTVFFEDFDGAKPTIQLNTGARLTDKDGGRFGRGLVTSGKEGGTSTQLSLGELPPKGTIEFWFKPATLPVAAANQVTTTVPLAITTQTPGMSETRMMFELSNWCATVDFGFRQGYAYDRAQSPSGAGAGWGWWQVGTWHHIAGSWDGDAMRVYVDGVLEGVCYGKDKMFPRGKAVDLLLPADGVIDEIRISKRLRYGPVVPDGVKPVLYSLATALEPPPAPAAKDVKEEELDRERARLISPVPDPKADYTFGIDQVRPAWEGMSGMNVRKDYFGKDADGIEAAAQQDVGHAMYWRIQNIEPGNYYIGLWAETSNGQMRTEYGVDKLLVSAYLNGWPVRFATTGEPVQVRSGVWLAELQTASPVRLKEGDEIAFWPDSRAEKQCFLRLALCRKKPAVGHGVTGQTFGTDGNNPQRLRLVISPEIRGSGEDGAKHEARIEIANPLPYAVDAEVTWKLADYYGGPVAGRTELLHMDPHKTFVISEPFTASGDAQAYQLDVKTHPAPDFKFSVPRPVEMLSLSDYSRFQFLPAQPDPLTVWNHTRFDLVENRTGDRKWVSLDGNDWEAAMLDGRRAPDTVPAGLVWTPFHVPYMDYWIKLPKDRFGRWYRKKFTAPQWLRGQRYIIELSQVSEEATVFLNNQRVGYGAGPLPVSADVTSAIKLGEVNELAICVRGGIALVAPDFVDKYDTEDYRAICENQDIQGTGASNAACLHSVRLRTAPEVRVKQSLVVPDVEKGTLRILTRVQNVSDRPREVTLRFEVRQNGKAAAVSIPPQKVTVKGGAVAEVAVDAPAGQLVPWTPRQPVLAKLATFVEENGAALDAFDRRFGYRTMKVKGTNLVFNGKPARYFGAFQRPASDIYEAENGVDCSRGATADGSNLDGTWDLYDEIGYEVLNNNVAFDCGPTGWKRLKNDKFWDCWRQDALEAVWNISSHPCVVGIDLSCESYCYTEFISGSEGQDKDGELIFSAVQEIRKKIWPDFWFIADSDVTLGGRLNFASFHYLTHYSLYDAFGQSATGGLGFYDGVAQYLPDGVFLNGAAAPPRPGMPLALRPNWPWGSTACGDTEEFEFWGLHNGVAVSKFIGDRAAVSAAYQFCDPRGMAWTKMAIDGGRDMEDSLFSGMYWKSFLGLAAQKVAFCMPQQEIRYYSGARFERRLNIHDDEYLPGKLLFQWKLLAPAGSVVKNGQIQADSDTAFLERARIAFDLPEVKERTAFRLTMELAKDGRRRAYEDRLVDVWPPLGSAPKVAIEEPVLVFDPNKTLLPCLEKLGCPVKPIDSLDGSALAGSKRLVIGPDCVTSAMSDRRGAIRDYACAGGRVLILHQDDPSLLPMSATVEKKAWFSVGFVRTGDHPVTRGLRDVDFQMWNPGHLIVKGAFPKPDKGAVLALVDSQNGASSWADMMEMYLGDGSVLASQLSLVDDFSTEPMCAELLRRALDYMAGPVFRPQGRPLAVLSGASEAVLKRLDEARTDWSLVPAPDPARPVTLIDLSLDRGAPDAAAIRAYASAGGTLILHRARPEHQAWMEAVLGRRTAVEVQPYQGWVDRQMLQRREGLVEGLSNLDFYWRTQRQQEDNATHWQVSDGVELGQERGQVQYLVKVAGIADYLFPGGLVEVPLGKGRVIIDQVKWEVPAKDMVCGSPARCLSVLLTNLGVQRRLPAPKPTLPNGVTYEPIDLSSVANRGFKDAKAGDGIGWLDWGPDDDLSSFPTGKVNLGGVPYLVPTGDKNCIMLRVNPEFVKCLANYPDSVAIPVGKRRVAGLFFLHTGGWAGGLTPFGERRIEYDDGTREIIRLNGTNMADWNPGVDNFPDEEGTTTTVVWTGANKMFPVIRVYQTLWVNPHPEKTIKQVVISNAGMEQRQWRVIPHFGLTAAILPSESNLPAAARDPDRSRSLLRDAMTLLEKKQAKEASAKLESALEADDQNTAAWIAITDLRAQTDTIDAFTSLCRRWFQALPKNYQGHNVLGKYLENKGKLHEAVTEFRKSIQIEWNQPLISQDIERLEKQLKEK